MNRTEYLDEIKEIIEKANNEISERDMFILASDIASEALGYIKDREKDK